eukprot:evm.model.scf_2018.2 EVM.evm.TU.scf_2018.2   scf_2018:11583-13045(+)
MGAAAAEPRLPALPEEVYLARDVESSLAMARHALRGQAAAIRELEGRLGRAEEDVRRLRGQQRQDRQIRAALEADVQLLAAAATEHYQTLQSYLRMQPGVTNPAAHGGVNRIDRPDASCGGGELLDLQTLGEIWNRLSPQASSLVGRPSGEGSAGGVGPRVLRRRSSN